MAMAGMVAAALVLVLASSVAEGAPVQVANPSTITVGNDDNAYTVVLHVGDRVLLKLGDTLDWAVTIADEAVVRRVTG